jgi:hypothetical protein
MHMRGNLEIRVLALSNRRYGFALSQVRESTKSISLTFRLSSPRRKWPFFVIYDSSLAPVECVVKKFIHHVRIPHT